MLYMFLPAQTGAQSILYFCSDICKEPDETLFADIRFFFFNLCNINIFVFKDPLKLVIE